MILKKKQNSKRVSCLISYQVLMFHEIIVPYVYAGYKEGNFI